MGLFDPEQAFQLIKKFDRPVIGLNPFADGEPTQDSEEAFSFLFEETENSPGHCRGHIRGRSNESAERHRGVPFHHPPTKNIIPAATKGIVRLSVQGDRKESSMSVAPRAARLPDSFSRPG